MSQHDSVYWIDVKYSKLKLMTKAITKLDVLSYVVKKVLQGLGDCITNITFFEDDDKDEQSLIIYTTKDLEQFVYGISASDKIFNNIDVDYVTKIMVGHIGE